MTPSTLSQQRPTLCHRPRGLSPAGSLRVQEPLVPKGQSPRTQCREEGGNGSRRTDGIQRRALQEAHARTGVTLSGTELGTMPAGGTEEASGGGRASWWGEGRAGGSLTASSPGQAQQSGASREPVRSALLPLRLATGRAQRVGPRAPTWAGSHGWSSRRALGGSTPARGQL